MTAALNRACSVSLSSPRARALSASANLEVRPTPAKGARVPKVGAAEIELGVLRSKGPRREGEGAGAFSSASCALRPKGEDAGSFSFGARAPRPKGKGAGAFSFPREGSSIDEEEKTEEGE